jgi:anti-anti-sigma regulatory factor
LRRFLLACRRARALPGFRRWQTFRILDTPGSTDHFIVVVDWESAAALRQAQADPVLSALVEEAPGEAISIAGPDAMPLLFDRQLSPAPGAATLLRLSMGTETGRGPAPRDHDFALRSLAAPGTIRMTGARDHANGITTCRIDFDTEDGLWHFLDSRLRQAWTGHTRRHREQEQWGLNLPRLEFAAAEPRAQRSRPGKNLSIELSFREEENCARLRLEGRMDAGSSRLKTRLWQALLDTGCTRLEVDVSGLASPNPETIQMLTRAAQAVKARGGQFILIDNEQRVRRVTREKHLLGSMR